MPLIPQYPGNTGGNLVTGLAQGLQTGLLTYQDLKQRDFDKKIKLAEIAARGYRLNEESGEIEQTEESKKRQADEDYEKTVKSFSSLYNTAADARAKGLINPQVENILKTYSEKLGSQASGGAEQAGLMEPSESPGRGLMAQSGSAPAQGGGFFQKDPSYVSPEQKVINAEDRREANRIKRENEKRDYENSSKGRFEKASGETKQKLGFLMSGFKNVSDYEQEFRKGGRREKFNPDSGVKLPFVGKVPIGSALSATPVDIATTNLTEAIGRLASGGAIGVQEEEKFLKMIPTGFDDDQSAIDKIISLRSEMELKLRSYGFSPDEIGGLLGIPNESIGYGTKEASMPKRGLLAKAKKEPIGTEKRSGAQGLLDYVLSGPRPQ